MESVSAVRCGIAQGGSRGVGNRARQEFASGRSRWCVGAGAWHIPARHRMYLALRHRGALGNNCEVQCGPAVRKKPRFTHVRDNLRGDVSGKRFNTHAVERNVARIGRAGVETTKGCKVRLESDDKRVERGWKEGRESDVGSRRVGAVGLGHMARQEFVRGSHRHVTVPRGFRHRVPSQGIDTGYWHRVPTWVSAT